MFAGTCIGSTDLDLAGRFYDAVLASVGMHQADRNDSEIGYAGKSGQIDFWVLTPFNGEPATSGNGSQVMFKALSHQQVDDFHASALQLGGSCDGAPGPRNYSPGYYGAYCRDPDGNKLHVFCRP
jgi:catechol 2,3-dioxygenase-like lactoylglutathione lyase family enzyme